MTQTQPVIPSFKRGTTSVKLNNIGLTTFPREIFKLAPTLTLLDLSGNKGLSELPYDFYRLTNLKILFLSDCSFRRWPDVLSRCRSLEMVAFKGNGMELLPEFFPITLRWLILTNNRIRELPESIGDCSRLQKLMLAGNELEGLPEKLMKCRKLGLLRLSANRLEELPEWLLEMHELSFLAFAGNKVMERGIRDSILDEVHWDELAIHEVLGQGASGIISKGIWTAADVGNEKHVAVKIFKGDVTSDGSPLDEMKACMGVGQHPHVISTIGRVHSHPETKKGLVLELIPPNFTVLGQPPNFETCTRDNYPEGLAYSGRKIKRILTSIASAALHLHEKGISHGDLYAHNILIDEAGHALLGDFGAATVYGRDHEHANLIERLEVLAFGHLIEDMLRLFDSENMDEKDMMLEAALMELHYLCINPWVEKRPNFESILEQLEAL